MLSFVTAPPQWGGVGWLFPDPRATILDNGDIRNFKIC
ncbi:hypothetical protein SPLC1_S032160 [Arthrospira platensis C1]|nr:hypothetical protein SPLC1_S032160 [Arthrospira platensis C1]